LLAALYLVVALTVPGAFLIAKQTSVVSSMSPRIVPAEHSSSPSEQFGGNAGEEDGGEDSWPGPKRLRGALLSKAGKIVGIDEILSYLIALVGGLRVVLEELEDAHHKLGFADEVQLPERGAFPQELLGRSPPTSR
jgi:hypothetical protein